MSRGRKNVSSSLGQKKERSEETQRWKALGQRSSPCYGQSIWKSPILGRRSCLSSGRTSTFLFSPKHPNLYDGACAERACPVPLSVCDADVHVVALCVRIYCLHLPAHVILYMSAWSCIFVCLIECVYSVIARGYKKLGPLCGSRGAVWMNAWRRPKITNPLNNPDWPRRKACANISWSACLWLTYFADVLKSGRQLLCPRETKREIIGTSGQPGVCKIKKYTSLLWPASPRPHWCRKMWTIN